MSEPGGSTVNHIGDNFMAEFPIQQTHAVAGEGISLISWHEFIIKRIRLCCVSFLTVKLVFFQVVTFSIFSQFSSVNHEIEC